MADSGITDLRPPICLEIGGLSDGLHSGANWGVSKEDATLRCVKRISM